MTPRPALILGAAALVAVLASPARAQLAPLMLLDMMFKDHYKKAAAAPGHAAWCAKHRAGYRAQWNNWRLPDGRVEYCSSPFYTVPWRPKGQVTG